MLVLNIISRLEKSTNVFCFIFCYEKKDVSNIAQIVAADIY